MARADGRGQSARSLRPPPRRRRSPAGFTYSLASLPLDSPAKTRPGRPAGSFAFVQTIGGAASRRSPAPLSHRAGEWAAPAAGRIDTGPDVTRGDGHTVNCSSRRAAHVPPSAATSSTEELHRSREPRRSADAHAPRGVDAFGNLLGARGSTRPRSSTSRRARQRPAATSGSQQHRQQRSMSCERDGIAGAASGDAERPARAKRRALHLNRPVRARGMMNVKSG